MTDKAMLTRIFLVGRGHLGSYFAQKWNIKEGYWWKQDLEALTPEVLQKVSPSAVVNCAGKTDLPWCENNPLEAFRCNVSAPVSCMRAVKAAYDGRVPFIHLSSGCVWEGPFRPDGEPFSPQDPPTPACFYAWTKVCADAVLLREATSPLLVVRPRQIYSPVRSPRNTLTKLIGYPKLLDTPNSMTSADTVARTIEAVLASERVDVWNRILLCYERGISSPFRVGLLLAKAGLRNQPELLTKTDLDSWHKPKRVDTVLRDECFEELVEPPEVMDELWRNIVLYKNNG